MSILACLIGILTLMISVTMQVRQIERQDQTGEEMEHALANRDLKYKTEAITREIRQLEQQLQKEKASAVEMARLEEHKIKLRLKLDEIGKARTPEESDASLQKTVEDLKLEIAALKRERPPLAQRLAALQAELKKRNDTPKPAEPVLIRPGGIGSRAARNLFFVECTSTGIILHGRDGPSKPISTAAIENNRSYGDLLAEVKRTRDSMVLFLIRRGGNEAYLWAAGIAEAKYGVLTGKLPVPTEGRIDTSLFNR
jgi:chaperonin cofactor prefoldin